LAEQHFTEALSISRENGWELETCLAQNNLGDVALWQDNLPAALTYYTDSLQIARQLNNSVMIASGLIFAGLTLCLLHQPAQANAQAREALTLTTQMGYQAQVAESLMVLGLAAEQQNQAQVATWHLSASAAQRDSINYSFLPVMQTPFEAALTRLSAGMGDKEFGAAWEKGGQLSPAEVLGQVL
jgi:hypothetical protein